MKKNIKRISISILTLGLILGAGLHTNIIKLPFVERSHPQYVANFNDDKVLLGASHNVFVAKITKINGNDLSDDIPSTKYKAQILDNVKGNLEGTVIIQQLAGYKNGILNIAEGDSLMEEGKTYILFTRYNKNANCYTVITHPNGKHEIEYNESEKSLSANKDTNKKIMKFKEAYKNEILLDADVKNKNTRNSYKSLNKNNE